jgi:hypothetical protein
MFEAACDPKMRRIARHNIPIIRLAMLAHDERRDCGGVADFLCDAPDFSMITSLSCSAGRRAPRVSIALGSTQFLMTMTLDVSRASSHRRLQFGTSFRDSAEKSVSSNCARLRRPGQCYTTELLEMDLLPFQDRPPYSARPTSYDERHLVTYLRLLDAEEEGADWRQVVLTIFGLDSEIEPQRARLVHESHLSRARWMTNVGYRFLLQPRAH